MPRPVKTAVGLIGVGMIGSRVAANLRKNGFEVWLWNRSPRPEPNFVSSAAEVAETCKIIQIFVPDGSALIETIEALRPSLGGEHLIIASSTVAPSEIMEASAMTAQAGSGFVEAPFTGSRDAAEAGELTYFVAGEEKHIERARPVLTASSPCIVPMGSIGHASVAKIATNMLVASTVQTLAEAFALADAAGIRHDHFAAALENHGARSRLLDLKLPLMQNGDFEPRSPLKHMFKDVRIALQLAEEHKLDLPSMSAAAGSLMAAIQKGWMNDDFAAVAKHYPFPGKQPSLPKSQASAPASHGPETASASAAGFRIFGSARKS